MDVRALASQDAVSRSACLESDDDVFWLQPRDGTTLAGRIRSRASAATLRLTTALGTCAAMTVFSAGTAFAPAAAHAGVNPASLDRISIGPVAVVDHLPIPIDEDAIADDSVDSHAIDDALQDMRAHEGAERQPERDPNEILQFGAMRVPRWVVETILHAADVTGVDPVYMMALADKESSFALGVKARTSSAEGLFQFVSRTWLEMVRDFGPKYGLQAEAAAVETIGGQIGIADDDTRERVLGLRRDPYLSALMAAEMLKRDRAQIEKRIGRELTRSEFYIAHFLGADSAGRFMELLDGKPRQSAPKIFPAAAKANKTLFFARSGRKTRHLSVAEVYDKIDHMIDARLDRYNEVAAVAAPMQAALQTPAF